MLDLTCLLEARLAAVGRRRDERGASAVEYGLLLAGIAAEIGLDQFDVVVTSIRRRGIRGVDPGPDARLAAGTGDFAIATTHGIAALIVVAVYLFGGSVLGLFSDTCKKISTAANSGSCA